MNDRFCERCGNPADPPTSQTRAGLTTCQACGIHACKVCWTRSVGWCPACGVSIAAAPLMRYLPTEQRRAPSAASGAPRVPAPAARTPGPRPSLSRLSALAAAAGALALTATVFALLFGAALGPTGGVAVVSATPGAPGPGGFGFASPIASQDAVGSDPTPADPTTTGSGGTGGPGATVPLEPGGTPQPQATPDPHASPPAPTPKPEPTAAPTPRPTLRPTPTPEPIATPTPIAGGCVAPNLVGQHRSDARRLWIEAGFTGIVTALAGQGNYLIAKQDRTPGETYPCDSGITIEP